MLIIAAILSVMLTLGIIAVGLYFLFTSGKKKSITTPDVESGDPKIQDEKPDFWYWLGFDEDAPNVYRAVCAGRSGKGTVLRYLFYGHDCSIDHTADKALYPEGKFVKKPIENGRYADEEGLPFDYGYRVRKAYGKRRYGWPLFNSLKWLTIDRVVVVKSEEIQEKTRHPDEKEKGPELLRKLTSATVRRKGLYEEITRPTFHYEIDSEDQTRFSAISTLIQKIIDPRPAFEKYPDSLLESISQIVGNFFSFFVNHKKYDDYKAAGVEGNKFNEKELAQLQKLLEPFGTEIKQFTMGDPELAKKIQDRFDAQATAKAEKASTIKKSEGEATAIRNKGNAEADASRAKGFAQAEVIERQAKAIRQRLTQLTKQYTSLGISGPDAAQMANQVLLSEFNAEAIQQFKGSVYAPGNSAGILVGTGGQK